MNKSFGSSILCGMRRFFCLRETGRKKNIFIYLLNTHLLVFLFVFLSIVSSWNSEGCDVSYLIKMRSDDILSSLLDRFLSTLENSFFLVWAMTCFSLTPFGVATSFGIVSFKSYSIGLILCNLYLQYRLKGILFGILVFLPGAFVSLYSLIYLIPISSKLSIEIFKHFLPKSHKGEIWENIKMYAKRLISSIYISLIASLLDFLLYGIFWKFFSI